MRSKERIDIVLKFFRKNPTIFSKFLYNDELIETPELTKDFEEFWKKHFDLRLGQALINFHLINDDLFIWAKEESDWLVENDYVPFENLNSWCSHYDKDHNKLPKPECRLLKDLSTEHIENILKWIKERNQRLPRDYMKYFNKRVKNKKHVDH